MVKILLESESKIPDFLQGEVPADGKLEFDDDTDAEGEGEDGADAAGWGGAPAADGWGGAPAAKTTSGSGNDGWGSVAPAADGWNTQATGDSW